MKSSVSTTIDKVDNIKLERIAKRCGLSKSDAVRMIYMHGVDFFLARLVGATKR